MDVRLSEKEIDCLKRSLARLDPDARLYLFGSRTDPAKRGGDIDLLIRSKRLTRNSLRRLRLDFFAEFGEQKLDIVIDRGESDPFIDLIRKKAVEL